jgi:hypothetical protein
MISDTGSENVLRSVSSLPREYFLGRSFAISLAPLLIRGSQTADKVIAVGRVYHAGPVPTRSAAAGLTDPDGCTLVSISISEDE